MNVDGIFIFNCCDFVFIPENRQDNDPQSSEVIISNFGIHVNHCNTILLLFVGFKMALDQALQILQYRGISMRCLH